MNATNLVSFISQPVNAAEIFDPQLIDQIVGDNSCATSSWTTYKIVQNTHLVKRGSPSETQYWDWDLLYKASEYNQKVYGITDNRMNFLYGSLKSEKGTPYTETFNYLTLNDTNWEGLGVTVADANLKKQITKDNLWYYTSLLDSQGEKSSTVTSTLWFVMTPYDKDLSSSEINDWVKKWFSYKNSKITPDIYYGNYQINQEINGRNTIAWKKVFEGRKSVYDYFTPTTSWQNLWEAALNFNVWTPFTALQMSCLDYDFEPTNKWWYTWKPWYISPEFAWNLVNWNDVWVFYQSEIGDKNVSVYKSNASLNYESLKQIWRNDETNVNDYSTPSQWISWLQTKKQIYTSYTTSWVNKTLTSDSVNVPNVRRLWCSSFYGPFDSSKFLQTKESLDMVHFVKSITQEGNFTEVSNKKLPAISIQTSSVNWWNVTSQSLIKLWELPLDTMNWWTVQSPKGYPQTVFLGWKWVTTTTSDSRVNTLLQKDSNNWNSAGKEFMFTFFRDSIRYFWTYIKAFHPYWKVSVVSSNTSGLYPTLSTNWVQVTWIKLSNVKVIDKNYQEVTSWTNYDWAKNKVWIKNWFIVYQTKSWETKRDALKFFNAITPVNDTTEILLPSADITKILQIDLEWYTDDISYAPKFNTNDLEIITNTTVCKPLKIVRNDFDSASCNVNVDWLITKDWNPATADDIDTTKVWLMIWNPSDPLKDFYVKSNWKMIWAVFNDSNGTLKANLNLLTDSKLASYVSWKELSVFFVAKDANWKIFYSDLTSTKSFPKSCSVWPVPEVINPPDITLDKQPEITYPKITYDAQVLNIWIIWSSVCLNSNYFESIPVNISSNTNIKKVEYRVYKNSTNEILDSWNFSWIWTTSLNKNLSVNIRQMLDGTIWNKSDNIRIWLNISFEDGTVTGWFDKYSNYSILVKDCSAQWFVPPVYSCEQTSITNWNVANTNIATMNNQSLQNNNSNWACYATCDAWYQWNWSYCVEIVSPVVNSCIQTSVPNWTVTVWTPISIRQLLQNTNSNNACYVQCNAWHQWNWSYCLPEEVDVNEVPNKPWNVLPIDWQEIDVSKLVDNQYGWAIIKESPTNTDNIIVTLQGSECDDMDNNENNDDYDSTEWQVQTTSDFQNPFGSYMETWINIYPWTSERNRVTIEIPKVDIQSKVFYWRFRYKDKAGQYSEWSDYTNFRWKLVCFSSPVWTSIAKGSVITVSENWKNEAFQFPVWDILKSTNGQYYIYISYSFYNNLSASQKQRLPIDNLILTAQAQCPNIDIASISLYKPDYYILSPNNPLWKSLTGSTQDLTVPVFDINSKTAYDVFSKSSSSYNLAYKITDFPKWNKKDEIQDWTINLDPPCWTDKFCVKSESWEISRLPMFETKEENWEKSIYQRVWPICNPEWYFKDESSSRLSNWLFGEKYILPDFSQGKGYIAETEKKPYVSIIENWYTFCINPDTKAKVYKTINNISIPQFDIQKTLIWCTSWIYSSSEYWRLCK